MAKFKEGQYSAPHLELEVRDRRISVLIRESGVTVVWNFSLDGAIRETEIRSPAVEIEEAGGADTQNVVFCCEHVKPGYSGVVYIREGDLPICVCPECVKLKGDISGGKLNAIDRELMDKMAPMLVITKLEG